jgi:tetratricopeptide (TPR) repeat protein
MSKHLLFLLFILAAALSVARANVAHWTEVRTSHFTVVSDSGEKQGRRIAREFERMRQVFQDVYPQLEVDPELPITILAIKGKEVFRSLEPDAYLRKGSLKLHGLFVPASEKNYILMRLDAEGGHPFPVAFHEYTHLLIDQESDSIPLWLNEGLAEFYANTEIRDQDVLLGQTNQLHLLVLRNVRLLPLTTLFTIDKNSPYYVEKSKGSIFYAESWALTHYLTLKDYEENTSKVVEYTRLLAAKLDPVTAGVRAFGDLKNLQKEIEAYIERPHFNQFRTKRIAHLDDSEFEIEPITPAQAEAVEADFLACSGRLAQARALAQRVLQEDPENASVQETLAFLNSADEAAAESNLRDAVQQDPSSAVAYDRLASFLWIRGKDLDQARKFESAAVSLDSGNLSYRLTLAHILLSVGSLQSAMEVLQDVSLIAKTPQENRAVEELLADATAYTSTRIPEKGEAEKAGTVTPRDYEQVGRSRDYGIIPLGPHLFLVGVLKAVHCDPPTLDLTVMSRAKTLKLHSENYYKVQFTALFTPVGDLKPCDDLENRPAKVEYVESANASDIPLLIAIELHK